MKLQLSAAATASAAAAQQRAAARPWQWPRPETPGTLLLRSQPTSKRRAAEAHTGNVENVGGSCRQSTSGRSPAAAGEQGLFGTDITILNLGNYGATVRKLNGSEFLRLSARS